MEKRYYRGNYCGENVLVVERSGRGSLRRRSSSQGIFRFWKCPSGRLQSGICPRGYVSQETVQLGNCPTTLPVSTHSKIQSLGQFGEIVQFSFTN